MCERTMIVKQRRTRTIQGVISLTTSGMFVLLVYFLLSYAEQLPISILLSLLLGTVGTILLTASYFARSVYERVFWTLGILFALLSGMLLFFSWMS